MAEAKANAAMEALLAEEEAEKAIHLHCSSARLPCSSGNRGLEMVFGDTEERLSQFGDKWQILNAIREHYLMKREADHGSQPFWDRIFLALGLQSFTPERLCCQAEKMAASRPAARPATRFWG